MRDRIVYAHTESGRVWLSVYQGVKPPVVVMGIDDHARDCREEESFAEMTQQQAAELVVLLQQFIDTGRVEYAPFGVPARPMDASRIREVEDILGGLCDFYSPGEAHEWFNSPQAMLDGNSPFELVMAGRGDEVKRLIGQLRDGAHI